MELEQVYLSGQLANFHQTRFPWNKGISWNLTQSSCEVAMIWAVEDDSPYPKVEYVSFVEDTDIDEET